MLDIKEILKTASAMSASDIHITVGTAPRLRINGGLQALDCGVPVPDDTQAIFNAIADDAVKARFDKRGDYEFSYSDPSLGRFRINAYKQRGSISLAIRLVGNRVPTAEETHLPAQLVNLAYKNSGLVIAAGTSGSGKSTSLAVLIDEINQTRNVHVITLEEPIEFLHRHQNAIIDQREVGVDSRDYEESIRSAIRSDPDVIMIEDLAEPNVIQMALDAAGAGKLVLSTVSAPSARAALDKLIDVFPDREQDPIRAQLARVLDTVFCQQLIPAEDGARVAAFEILNARFREIGDAIRSDATQRITTIIKENPKANMLAMDDDLLHLVRADIISKKTALKFARDPAYITDHIAG